MDISQAWTQWICPRFARGYRMDMDGTSWLGQMDILQIRRSGRAWTWQGHGTRNGQRWTRTGPRDARRSAADTDRATRRETVDGGHGTGRASECQNAFGQFRRCAKGKLPFVPTKTLVNTSLLSLPSVNHVSTPLAAGALNDY